MDPPPPHSSGLHPCSEAPSANWESLEKDANFLQILRDNFTFSSVYVAGKGSNNLVFSIKRKSTNERVAVKIFPYYDAMKNYANHELAIACEVNSLAKFTSVFVETHGYIVARRLIDSWARLYKEHFGRTEPLYLYLFMSQPSFSLNQRAPGGGNYVPYAMVGLNRPKYAISLFFLLIHGLYVARKYLGGFVHNDLHAGNIMFFAEEQGEGFSLEVETQQVNVTFLRGWTPKIIDMGSATTKAHAYGQPARTRDVAQLIRALGGNEDFSAGWPIMEYFYNVEEDVAKDNYQALLYSNGADYETLARFLLDDPVFRVDSIVFL